MFDMFARSLHRNEERVALVAGVGRGRREVTYRELDRHIDAACTQFGDAGLRAGDRVLLAVPPSIETYVAMLAMMKSGIVVMVIDPAHGARKVSGILREWPPDAVVASRSILLLGLLVPELRRIPVKFSASGRMPGASPLSLRTVDDKPVDTFPRSSADSALLTFTSGSTGMPKPVVRTHGFLREQLRVLRPVAELRNGDVDFVAMPMFVLFNLANGVTSVLPACDMKNPGRANPRLVHDQLLAENVNRMVAAPALLDRLAAYCVRRRQSLPGLRIVSTGGGPVSPSLPGRLAAVAPNAVVRMVYGSTEAEPIASIDHNQLSVTANRRMRGGGGLLAGRPVDGCDVAIIRSSPGADIPPLSGPEFARIQLPAGAIGEIAVAGKHVLAGYADPARDRSTKIRVDDRTWHRTGDCGYVDDDGSLWLVGRQEAAIRDALGTVYPFQVEYALSDIPGIRRAALTQHDGLRTLVLEVRGRAISTASSEAAACIARHGIERIVTVRRIPLDKRHNSKVDYPALARLLEGRGSGFRLQLVDVVAGLYRELRRVCRGLARLCQSIASGTKVGPCRTRTK
jgi:acyl-CoA synthetase (AMP-forming)/AMP-acid ligase II